ncbi:Type IV pilus biogenesis and competence protein PilQ precursor [Pseudobythopirellula maris]|uniref:Type IV pilus biogenesis and competence protein PilQ n=1 Tax=Pseudobythopirellula maris TaxID=2527991 RepID=A0A5C5ZR02_9BACT|nr:hypothetical protein [Pseudobythopirellula maris]TWT89924.1 Type IV pilus biogenesis and competence protein PilQ precursor [Pseudobythopirellula maris]
MARGRWHHGADRVEDPRGSLRTRSVRGLAMLLAALLICPPLAAQAQEAAAPKAGPAQSTLADALERRGDLTLRDSTLEGALFTISELWGINIVSAGANGTVNGVFKDAPLREILDSILLSNGFGYRPVGASLVVSPLEQLGKVNPYFVSATIPVTRADVAEVVAGAQLLTTPQGQIRAIPSARSIFVLDFADRVEKIREFVETIDGRRAPGEASQIGGGNASARGSQLEVAYFRVHYITAVQAESLVTPLLSSVGKSAILQGEDRMLVIDYGRNVQAISAVLDRFDRPRPQVTIKALIYDISLSDLEEIGLNWSSQNGGSVSAAGVPQSGNGLMVDSALKAPFDASGNGGTFTFFSLSNSFNLQAVALALQSAGDSRLLADPNVTVVDNEEANIESVSEIPYQQLTQTAAGGQIGTTSFKEAGIKLRVTPKIARDGTIDLVVEPEFSRLAGYTEGDSQPIIDTRRASTRVRIANRQTLMIGGLRQRADVGDFRGIPGLKDMRVLGHLFRARETEIRESELVVFLTPEIVGYSDPLNRRDQLSADTVRCRLARIPFAEGCPPGECYNGDPCGDDIETGSCSTCETVPVIVPPTMDSQGAPVLEPSSEHGPYPASETQEILPIPSEPGPGGDDFGVTTPRGRAVTPTPYRLPTVDGASDTHAVATRPADPEASDEAAEEQKASRMRPDFESRFRSTGGVYANQQRKAPAEQDTQAETAEGQPKKSAWRRLMWW